MSKEEKEVLKNERNKVVRKRGFAILDRDRIERMGNYTVEPPNLFRGRGFHPKMGTLKQRVMPEEITLNLSRGGCLGARRVLGGRNPVNLW